MRRFAIRQHPDVGGNARVVEHVERQRHDGLQPVALDDPAADVALALPGVPGEEGAAVVHLGDAAAHLRAVFHLAEHVGQEHHLAVAGAGDEDVLRVALVRHDEARVPDARLAAHALQVALPGLAVGRIGEHEVELAGGEGVGGERGAVLHVVGFHALALEDEVGLADGVGFGVDLLAVEVDRNLLAVFGGELRQRLFGNCQHPAGAAGAVVDQVGAGPDRIGDRHEDQARHELYDVARGEVLPRLLVVLLVEAPDELFEDRAHPVVVQALQAHGAVPVQDGSGAEVDRAVQELLQQEAQRVRFHQRGNLVAEPELLQDLLHVGREAVEVGLEVGSQLLLPPAGSEVSEPEGGRVVEGLAGGLAQRRILVGDAGLVQPGLHAEHRVLRRLQHRIQPADDRHGQDDVAVLAPHVDVAQHVVRDAPDEAADVQGAHTRSTAACGRIPIRIDVPGPGCAGTHFIFPSAKPPPPSRRHLRPSSRVLRNCWVSDRTNFQN